LEAHNRWIECSRAKDEMFKHPDLHFCPWWIVAGDNIRARLNCISHLLSQFDYDEIEKPELDLTERRAATGYTRPPMG
jgi:polyphosphate kinase 2 (PPK2 family)